MRYHARKLAATIENNSVWTRACAPIEDSSAGEDGELVPRARGGEVEPFVVVVAVRVVIGADGLATLP